MYACVYVNPYVPCVLVVEEEVEEDSLVVLAIVVVGASVGSLCTVGWTCVYASVSNMI